MRISGITLAAVTLFSIATARADEAADAKAIVTRAIKASGGQEALAKYKASTAKIKGELQAMGATVPFTGEMATDGNDRQRLALELELGGQKFTVTQVLNRDKGWVKLNDETMDMDADKLAEALEQAHSGWVMTLVPLLAKEFTLTGLGESDVEGKPALGLRATFKGRRDISLFFDKQTHLLVKTESRVKDEESGQEVNEETLLSQYEGKEVKQPMKLNVKRDGKRYIDAELSDLKMVEKLDDETFAKP